MKGGKDHTSHRLASLGLSHRVTVLILYAICIVFGFTAIDLSHASVDEGLEIGFRLAVAAVIAFVFLEYVYIRNKQK